MDERYAINGIPLGPGEELLVLRIAFVVFSIFRGSISSWLISFV